MILLPGQRPGEAGYASVDDWLTVVDLPEADVCLPIAPRAGKVFWLRYRALDLQEEQAAWRAARAALLRYHIEAKLPPPGPDEVDFSSLMLETLQRGIVMPRLTPAQAQALRHKNPHLLRQVYQLIKGAGAFTPEGLEDVVDELVRTRTAGSADAAPPGDGDTNTAALGTDGGDTP